MSVTPRSTQQGVPGGQGVSRVTIVPAPPPPPDNGGWLLGILTSLGSVLLASDNARSNNQSGARQLCRADTPRAVTVVSGSTGRTGARPGRAVRASDRDPAASPPCARRAGPLRPRPRRDHRQPGPGASASGQRPPARSALGSQQRGPSP